jgi:hypothetical protein
LFGFFKLIPRDFWIAGLACVWHYIACRVVPTRVVQFLRIRDFFS